MNATEALKHRCPEPVEGSVFLCFCGIILRVTDGFCSQFRLVYFYEHYRFHRYDQYDFYDSMTLMPRKRILWLCSWYPGKTEPFNGDFIQRHARAAALYNDIYVIHVAGDGSGKIKTTEEEINRPAGLTEHIVYYKKTATSWGRLVSHYRWLRLFRHAIRKYIRENGKPDLVHVQVPIKAGILGIWMKRRWGIPFIVTEHWGIYNDVEALNYSSRNKTFKHYTKAILSNAAKLISVSDYLAKAVNRIVVKKDYEVIPNAVNTDLFFCKEKMTPPIDRSLANFRFIHVSNMVPLKNAEGILRAFKLLRQQNSNASLLMVGDTDPAIRKYAAILGLPEQAVSFQGEVPYVQVAKEMQESDCFVLNSNIENSPCVISEALCCGLPVIATNVGGIPELVNETNGLLVTPQNDVLLAATMQAMINEYSNYNSKKIADDAVKKFSYGQIGRQFDKLYKYKSVSQ